MQIRTSESTSEVVPIEGTAVFCLSFISASLGDPTDFVQEELEQRPQAVVFGVNLEIYEICFHQSSAFFGKLSIMQPLNGIRI